jgi:universal stress protein A
MFDKILVAIDLEPDSAGVLLNKARELSRGEVWAIHSVEPQYVQYSIDPTFTGSLTRAMEVDAIEAARARMAEICMNSGVPEERQLITLGRASDKIHEAAGEYEFDTILIGSHARKGIRRLLGSTANAVLHNSPVNVLTVRVPE